MSGPACSALAVVIPVRDEAALIGQAVVAALAAMTAAESSFGVRTLLVLAFDTCVDDSELAARAASAGDPRVEFVRLESGMVGRTRAVGVATALGILRLPPSNVWIANSDGDSQVPAHWCVEQLREAAEGAAAIVGTVIPTGSSDMNETLSKWADDYRPVDGHEHVHGANLGVRADAYLASGGFPPVTHDEDVRLVQALRAGGYRVVASARCPVHTSARTLGRAPHGFADYLAGLQSDAPRSR